MTTPSAALSIRPPANPIDQYGKLISLRSLLNTQQLQQAQLAGEQQLQQQRANLFPSQLATAQAQQQSAETQAQEQALQFKSTQGLMKALEDSMKPGAAASSGPGAPAPGNAGAAPAQGTSGSYDRFVQNLMNPAYGILPSQIATIRKGFADMRTSLANADKSEIDAAQAAHTQFVQMGNAVLALPPAQQAQAYASARNRILSDPTLGKYAGDLPAQYPGAAALQNTLAGLEVVSDFVNQTKEAAQLPGQIATSTIAQQKAALGPKGVAQATAEGTIEGQIAGANAALAKNGAFLDQAASDYITTGQLPRLYGEASGPISMAIIERAAQMNPGINLPAARAQYDANKGALESLQKNYDAVEAFEQTAGKNLAMFVQQASADTRTISPWLNTPLRSLMQGVGGSKMVAAANAAHQVATNEIAKVISSPTMNGVLSDSARKEAEQLNPKNATLGQVLAVSKMLMRDMNNRTQAYADQINEIQARIANIARVPNQKAPNALTPNATPAIPGVNNTPSSVVNSLAAKYGGGQ